MEGGREGRREGERERESERARGMEGERVSCSAHFSKFKFERCEK